MKRLLPLLSSLLLGQASMAQNTLSNSNAPEEKTALRELVARYAEQKKMVDTSDLTEPKSLYLVNPKPGVHSLPQDNMPCIVPDVNASIAMPNSWGGDIKVPFRGATPRMPNPAKPLKLAPSRPLLTHPNADAKKLQ